MPRRLRWLAVVPLALLTLPGCSSVLKVGLSVDPPTAAVYINGVRDGQGERRIRDFDFGEYERVCVQAAAPGFEPRCEMLTRQQVLDQIAKYGDYVWVLRQEK